MKPSLGLQGDLQVKEKTWQMTATGYMGQGNIDRAFMKLNSCAPADMQKGPSEREPEGPVC